MPCFDAALSLHLNKVFAGRVQSQFRRLSVNSVLQVTGQLIPLLFAAAAIPVVYRRVGAADFGIFTLALSALGLFSIMDLGLGRATVRFVTHALAKGDIRQADSIASQSVVWLGLLSLLLCLLFVLYVPGVAARWLLGEADGEHLRQIIYILAVSIPFLGVTSSLRSVLEAREQFPTIALIQGIFGSLTYGAPLITSLVTSDIRAIVAGAVVARVLAFGVFWAAARAFWAGPISVRLAWSHRGGEFLKFSGWLVVSNIVGNSVVYADRALLASLFPIARLPFYNVPLEFLIRLMIVVNAAITVAFPFLSRVAVDTKQLDRIHVLAVAALGASAAAAFLVLSIVAPVGLEIWLGLEFRDQSSEIVRVLLIGLLFLSLNALSLALLNARGISRRIALMHVAEAPIYLWALAYYGRKFELVGVAAVWSARMVVEFVCYTLMHASDSPNWRRQLGGGLAAALQVVPLVFLAMSNEVIPAVALCFIITVPAAFWTIRSLRSQHVDKVDGAATGR